MHTGIVLNGKRILHTLQQDILQIVSFNFIETAVELIRLFLFQKYSEVNLHTQEICSMLTEKMHKVFLALIYKLLYISRCLKVKSYIYTSHVVRLGPWD